MIPATTVPTLTKPASKKPPAPSTAWARKLAGAILEKKGSDLRLLRVDSLVDYADFFIFATASNRRQVQAIAESVEKLAKNSGRAVRTEGFVSGWWVIVDSGGVVIHIFQPEAREFYDLDHLWADAKSLKIDSSAPVGSPSRGSGPAGSD